MFLAAHPYYQYITHPGAYASVTPILSRGYVAGSLRSCDVQEWLSISLLHPDQSSASDLERPDEKDSQRNLW